MGRSAPSRFYRAAYPPLHDWRLAAQRLVQRDRRLRERRPQLSDLVGNALLCSSDDRARLSFVSRRMELGPIDRDVAAVAEAAPSHSRARNSSDSMDRIYSRA